MQPVTGNNPERFSDLSWDDQSTLLTDDDCGIHTVKPGSTGLLVVMRGS